MTTNHLLSTSLFTELFQHNIVSADGRIIADPKQLENYSTFLMRRSKEKSSCLFIERKNMVKALEKLIKMEFRTEKQNKLMKMLLNELDLKYEEDGLLSLKEQKKRRRKYLGPSEPRMSLFEREIAEELKRVQILKRDLRILDDWLIQISSISYPMPRRTDQLPDWKEQEWKFRQRTANRMCDMENARTKLIKQYYTDYNQMLKKVLLSEEKLKGTGRDHSTTGRNKNAKISKNVPQGKSEKERAKDSQIKVDSDKDNMIKEDNSAGKSDQKSTSNSQVKAEQDGRINTVENEVNGLKPEK